MMEGVEARPAAEPAPTARRRRWSKILKWGRRVVVYVGGLVAEVGVAVSVAGGAFVLSAALFSPEEHEAARDRVAGAWRVWSELFGSGEPAHQWAAGTHFEKRDVAGVRFTTGLTDRPGFKQRWCYVQKSGRAGGADIIVELAMATAIGDEALVPRWNELSVEQAQHFDKTPSELADAARTGCLMS